MKLKLNLPFLIILFLFLEVYGFSLKLLGSTFFYFNSNQQGVLATITVIFAFALIRFSVSNSEQARFGKLVLAFILICGLEFCYSVIRYGQGVINVFICSNYVLIILIYFVLTYYFRNYGIEQFNNWVVNISLINMIIHIAQYILYRFGIVFLFFNAENTRMGALRLGTATSVISLLGVLVAFCYLISNNAEKRIKHSVTVLLGVISLLIISRGRAAILCITMTMVISLIKVNKKNVLKIIGGGLFIIVIGYFLLNYTSLGISYMESIETEDTLSYRMKEIQYYFDQVLKNPLLGIGFIRRMGNTWQTQIITGPRYHYSRTDVGIVGFLNTFGVVGLVWYLFLMSKWTKYVKSICRSGDNRLPAMIVFVVYVWNLTYLPTLMLFGVFSICIPAILMAYVDYYGNEAMVSYGNK